MSRTVDPTLELEKRALIALKNNGKDATDPIDGSVIGLKAQVADILITSDVDHKIRVVAMPSKVALTVDDTGMYSFYKRARDYALSQMRKHQVLDDLAEV